MPRGSRRHPNVRERLYPLYAFQTSKMGSWEVPSPPIVVVTERGRWERHLKMQARKGKGRNCMRIKKYETRIMGGKAEGIYKLVGRGIAG